jgi:hypothetical protein
LDKGRVGAGFEEGKLRKAGRGDWEEFGEKRLLGFARSDKEKNKIAEGERGFAAPSL